MARPTAAPIIALPIVTPRRVLTAPRRSGRDAAGKIAACSRTVSRVNCRTMTGCTDGTARRRAGRRRCHRRRRDAAPAFASSGGRAQLAAFGLEHVVQAPFGELDAGGEPEVSGLLHVMDDAAQRQRTPGPPDDVGMHGEGNVFRALRAALRVELV